VALLLNPERRLASYHLTSSLLGIAFAAIVLWLLRRDHLQVLLGAFWIGVSALVLLLGLWPGLLDGLAAMAGISYSPALLLLIAVLVLVYLILGTALDGISMIVLTSAVVLPLIQKAGFDLVWFGIFIILLIEIAEITPPVGFNLFVLQNMTGVDSNRIARVTLPFFGCMLVAIVLITVFPQIVTSVPDALMGVSK